MRPKCHRYRSLEHPVHQQEVLAHMAWWLLVASKALQLLEKHPARPLEDLAKASSWEA
jgi:hypothetical protein